MNRPLNANADAEPPIEPQLVALLDTLRVVLPRDPQAAIHGRAAFLAEAAQRKSASAGWGLGARLTFTAVMRPAFALLVVLAALTFGGATVVVAAQGSLPDEPLYSVKLWSEDARLSLSSSSDARLSLLVEFANRRKAELDALQARQMQPSPMFYERFSNQVDEALTLGGADANLEEDDRAELESLRDQINPATPTVAPAATSVPTDTPAPVPSATPTALPLTDAPIPAVAPAEPAVPIEPAPTLAPTPTPLPTPTRARRDDIRATLTALPRPDVRATRDASPPPNPPPTPDVRATRGALPTREPPPPAPDFAATKAALATQFPKPDHRATRQALPTPTRESPPPTPDLQATPAVSPTPPSPPWPPSPDIEATRDAIRATREAMPSRESPPQPPPQPPRPEPPERRPRP